MMRKPVVAVDGFEDLDAVTNGLTMPWRFGRASLPLLRERVLLTAQSQPAARKTPCG